MIKPPLAMSKIVVGVGATAFILFISLLLSFQRFNDLKNTNGWNVYSYQVILEANHMLNGLASIQAGARGFLHTRDERLLDPYKNGLKQYRTHYGRAISLTRSSPQQQANLKKLNAQFLEWKNGYIDPLLKMRRATPSTEKALKLANRGVLKRRSLFSALRTSVAAIEDTENNLLRERTIAEDSAQKLAQITLLLISAIAIALSTVVTALLGAKSQELNTKSIRLAEKIAEHERGVRGDRGENILDDHNRMILHAARDGIMGINQAGRATFFNPAAEAITGYTASEIVGKLQHSILHPRRSDGTPCAVADCPIMATARDGETHRADNEVFWHKDGRPVPIEYTMAPLMSQKAGRDENGEAFEATQVGAVIMFRDITERKKTEAALRELASIVRYSSDAIIGFTLEGIITIWNEAATEVYGYSQSEMLGENVDRLVVPGEMDELPELLARIKAHQPVDRYETAKLRKDGSTVQVVLSLSPTIDEAGNVVGASSMSREVFRNRIQKTLESNQRSG